MHKHSVNRRLREELSPERTNSYGSAASPTSSTSSRETTSRPHRRRSRSPYRPPRGEKRSREEDHRSGHQSYKAHNSRPYYESRHHESVPRSPPAFNNDHNRKGDGPYIPDDYPVKRPRKDGSSPGQHEAYEYGVNGYHAKSALSFRGQKEGNSHNNHKSGSQPAGFRTSNEGKPDIPKDVRLSSQAKRVDHLADSKTNKALIAANQSVLPTLSHITPEADSHRSGGNGTAKLINEIREGHESGAAIDRQIESVTQEVSAEERRRRREAIRARFKDQSTDLRVQAIEQSASPASALDAPKTPGDRPRDYPNGTPSTPTASTTPQQLSPKTPASGSAIGSPEPVAIANDAELANTNLAETSPGEQEEASAADYDPTDDMREERLRHDKRLYEGSIPAQAYDETTEEQHQVLVPDTGIVKPTDDDEAKVKSNEDDMFASDDDDDDMFAAEPTSKTTKPSSQSSKSVSKGKEIDTSMLDNWDDPDGYYRPILGETIDGRYQVQSNLGKGMFSGVVRATDLRTNQMKAIKIIRNNESMVKAAQKEMAILEKLAEADPDDKKHIVRLERSFTHRDHLCLVFENLSLNLREVLKKFGRDIGINIKAIRSYAQQMFLALGLMRKCNIYHADLKPDNILVTEDRATLKVCDLGSAGDGAEFEIAPYLVSRYYRAPEIILGCPYDFAIDMWSIGCTLFELFTGKILFTGRDNNGMLRNIMETRGKVSVKMLKRAEFGAVHFEDLDRVYFRSVEREKGSNREVVKLLNFQKPTRELKDRVLAAAPKGISEAERKELLLFADLLDKCLLLNPERRITPIDALKHPFIHRGFMPIGGK